MMVTPMTAPPLLAPEPIGGGEWIKEVYKTRIVNEAKHKACADKWIDSRNRLVAMFWRWRMDCHTETHRAMVIVDSEGNEISEVDVRRKNSYS